MLSFPRIVIGSRAHVQVLKMQRPTNGYAYFGLYAEGNDAPGIKEGINEKGLTVVTASAGTIPKPDARGSTGKRRPYQHAAGRLR